MKALKSVKGVLRGIPEGDEEACEKLMYALILSGLAMQMTGNSRPASGAEHSMSHLWEMEVINRKLNALHGEKVSVGTMVVLREYKKIADAVRRGKCRVTSYENRDRELLEKVFGKKGLLKQVIKENEPDLLEEISVHRLESCLLKIAEIVE